MTVFTKYLQKITRNFHKIVDQNSNITFLILVHFTFILHDFLLSSVLLKISKCQTIKNRIFSKTFLRSLLNSILRFIFLCKLLLWCARDFFYPTKMLCEIWNITLLLYSTSVRRNLKNDALNNKYGSKAESIHFSQGTR